MAERTAIINGRLHRLVLVDRSWLDRMLRRQRSERVPVEPEYRG